MDEGWYFRSLSQLVCAKSTLNENDRYLTVLVRHWKDHFKSELRSDQDHRLKKDLRSDQDQFFLKNDLDLKSRSKIIFCLKKLRS
jgi:hypothetical protein